MMFTTDTINDTIIVGGIGNKRRNSNASLAGFHSLIRELKNIFARPNESAPISFTKRSSVA